MTFLTIAVIVIGGIIAYFAATAPQRTLQLFEEAEAKKLRTERLSTQFSELCELTEHSRSIIEQASQRPDLTFIDEEIDVLLDICSVCESVLPSMDKDSPILDRLYRNHIAVISHILGESDKEASRAVLFKNALEDIYRFQVYEKSDHPIAVMEKRLAMGLSA